MVGKPEIEPFGRDWSYIAIPLKIPRGRRFERNRLPSVVNTECLREDHRLDAWNSAPLFHVCRNPPKQQVHYDIAQMHTRLNGSAEASILAMVLAYGSLQLAGSGRLINPCRGVLRANA
jgi:hypothetical protein